MTELRSESVPDPLQLQSNRSVPPRASPTVGDTEEELCEWLQRGRRDIELLVQAVETCLNSCLLKLDLDTALHTVVMTGVSERMRSVLCHFINNGMPEHEFPRAALVQVRKALTKLLCKFAESAEMAEQISEIVYSRLLCQAEKKHSLMWRSLWRRAEAALQLVALEREICLRFARHRARTWSLNADDVEGRLDGVLYDAASMFIPGERPFRTYVFTCISNFLLRLHEEKVGWNHSENKQLTDMFSWVKYGLMGDREYAPLDEEVIAVLGWDDETQKKFYEARRIAEAGRLDLHAEETKDGLRDSRTCEPLRILLKRESDGRAKRARAQLDHLERMAFDYWFASDGKYYAPYRDFALANNITEKEAKRVKRRTREKLQCMLSDLRP